MYDILTGQYEREFDGKIVAVNDDGSRIATTSYKSNCSGQRKCIFLYDTHNGHQSLIHSDFYMPIALYAFSPDSTLLYIYIFRRNLILTIDTQNEMLIRKWQVPYEENKHPGSVKYDLSPTGKYILIWNSLKKYLCIFDVSGQRLLWQECNIDSHTHYPDIIQVSLHEDGCHIFHSWNKFPDSNTNRFIIKKYLTTKNRYHWYLVSSEQPESTNRRLLKLPYNRWNPCLYPHQRIRDEDYEDKEIYIPHNFDHHQRILASCTDYEIYIFHNLDILRKIAPAFASLTIAQACLINRLHQGEPLTKADYQCLTSSPKCIRDAFHITEQIQPGIWQAISAFL